MVFNILWVFKNVELPIIIHIRKRRGLRCARWITTSICTVPALYTTRIILIIIIEHRIICRRRLINVSLRISTGNSTHHHGGCIMYVNRRPLRMSPEAAIFINVKVCARTPTSARRVGFNFGTDFERLITPPRGRRRI